MVADLRPASFIWAQRLAARCGFVVGNTIESPEGYQYLVESVGFGADTADVELRLVGQPKAPLRTITIREDRPNIFWGKQTM